MLVLSCLKTLNSIKPITLKNQLILCSTIKRKRDISFQHERKFNKKCLNQEEVYDVCIKNGLSSNAVASNDWIFDLNVRK